jgi:AcrR family transcriptional regulator
MGRRKTLDTLQTRERILDAALRAIEKTGFSRTTIDDVIAEASISKGGFLYHFPTKLSCFLALVDRTFASILDDARQHYRRLPDGPGRMLKAYIIAWLDWQEPPRYLPIMGLLEEEELQERVIQYRLAHYELVLDPAIPELTAQAVLTICSGLWTIPPFARATPEQMTAFRRRMRDVMFNLIDQASIGSPNEFPLSPPVAEGQTPQSETST